MSELWDDVKRTHEERLEHQRAEEEAKLRQWQKDASIELVRQLRPIYSNTTVLGILAVIQVLLLALILWRLW